MQIVFKYMWIIYVKLYLIVWNFRWGANRYSHWWIVKYNKCLCMCVCDLAAAAWWSAARARARTARPRSAAGLRPRRRRPPPPGAPPRPAPPSATCTPRRSSPEVNIASFKLRFTYCGTEEMEANFLVIKVRRSLIIIKRGNTNIFFMFVTRKFKNHSKCFRKTLSPVDNVTLQLDKS